MPHARVGGLKLSRQASAVANPPLSHEIKDYHRAYCIVTGSSWDAAGLVQAATAKGDPAAPCAMGPSHNGHGHYYSSKSLGVPWRHPRAPSGMSRLPAVPTDCVRDVCFCAAVLSKVQTVLHCQQCNISATCSRCVGRAGTLAFSIVLFCDRLANAPWRINVARSTPGCCCSTRRNVQTRQSDARAWLQVT